jgi:flagellar hook-associated protein 3 FlgL
VPGNYSLEFTAADTWQVLDANSNVVTSGPYVSGAALAFNGVQVAVSGTPETGDTYSISAAGKEDIFTTLDSLTSSLSAAVDNPVGRADLTSSLAKALVQLDQGLSNAQNLRAETGTRLSALDSAATVRQQLADELTGSVGKLQDLDYAEATGRMNQQMLGLQAAQAAYGRIAQLSLFTYL